MQKLTYLRNFLGGEAKRTLDGLATTDANYSLAYELLKERYGQPQIIINAHMKALWELPTPVNNTASLRQFYDELETNIRGLKVLGENEVNYGKLLIPMILEKLPIEFQRQLARIHGNTAWSLPQLRNAMVDEIRVLSVGNEHSTYHDIQPPTIAAFYTKSTAPRQNVSTSGKRYAPHSKSVQRQCVYCNGQHKPNECVVISVDTLTLNGFGMGSISFP